MLGGGLDKSKFLLKLNSQSKTTFKKSGDSNTNGNSSSNIKSSSGSSGPSNNFNGLAGSVASEEQEVNLPVGGRLFHFKQVWRELGLSNFCQEVVSGLKVYYKVHPNLSCNTPGVLSSIDPHRSSARFCHVIRMLWCDIPYVHVERMQQVVENDVHRHVGHYFKKAQSLIRIVRHDIQERRDSQLTGDHVCNDIG
ncbi:hypothetical protein ACTFIU_005682 [Dictyostelium citrinum]